MHINETEYPAIYIEVLPGFETSQEKLGFDWLPVNLTHDKLRINLEFEYPEFISALTSSKEYLSVTFYDHRYFKNFNRVSMLPGVTVGKYLPTQATPPEIANS